MNAVVCISQEHQYYGINVDSSFLIPPIESDDICDSVSLWVRKQQSVLETLTSRPHTRV